MDTGWNFDNTYARLPAAFYSLQNPEHVLSPGLAVLNGPLARYLGLDEEWLKSPIGMAELSGNAVPAGARPLAQAYSGHQFGYFTMLGDGRALLLGEQITPLGTRLDIQLKGSGKTPFSRGGDGKAALGPMLREYMISEAMHALGVPTSRSLAVVTTGEPVYRETPLIGAVLTRVASSHIRIGTFEYASRFLGPGELKLLADYTIERHCPKIKEDDDRYIAFLSEAVSRQARLIAQWMLIGFVHGVMNTDNIAVSGETIDYGPCAFLDVYDPETVFSSIDEYGRYSYANQPDMALWGLARLAEALLPLIHHEEARAVKLAQDALSEFETRYREAYTSGMRAKLGLFSKDPGDGELISGLLDVMRGYKADYTNTFAALARGGPEEVALLGAPEFKRWGALWQSRLRAQNEPESSCRALMRRSSPAVIPRNHIVEEALSAAESGDYSVMHDFLDALSSPYSYQSDKGSYCAPPPPSACPYRTFCGT